MLTNWSGKYIVQKHFPILIMETTEKLKIFKQKKVEISPFSANFGRNFGHFRAKFGNGQISGVFSQNFVPEIL